MASRVNECPITCRGRVQRLNQWQRQFSFRQIVANVFPITAGSPA